MANETEYSSIIRDALTGDSVGLNTWADVVPGASRDVLTGDRYGILLVGDAYHIAREQLTGDRYGLNVYGEVLPGNAREILTGDGFGMTWLSSGVQIVREAIIMEPPYKMTAASREVIVSLPNDPLTVARVIIGYRQSVVMVRPKMALPSTVKSPQIVPTLRQQIVRKADRAWARSGSFAASLRVQHVVLRNVLPAYDMNSFATVGNYVEQVVRSRDQTYIPVSAVYTKAQRQLVVSTRVVTRAPDVRTEIRVGTQRQQILLSRKTVVVVIMTEAHAASLVQQAVVEDTRPAPHSEIRAAKLLHMTVQKHNVVPPGIDDRVAQHRQQITMARVPAEPFSGEYAAKLSQQIVAEREAVMHKSMLLLGGERMLTVIHRDTYPPAAVVGRHTSTLHQQAVMKRARNPVKGSNDVGSMRLVFTVKRVVPAPWDVIDPSIGRHVGRLSALSVHRRVTIPPATVSKESRYVFNVAAQVALGDKFPAPDMPPQPGEETGAELAAYQVVEQMVHRDAEWGPVSAVSVIELASPLVVGDNAGWIDPTLPNSEVFMFTAQQAIALGDVFPDPAIPGSAEEVAMLGQVFAVADRTMPDPMLPLSEIQASAVIEMAAVGDAQFPDPTIPLSEVRSSLVASSLAVHDPSLVGQFGMSEISVPSILEFLIIRDPALVGIPLRQGARPIITVSMS